MIIEVADSEMFLLRMLYWRLDMPSVLASFPQWVKNCAVKRFLDWGRRRGLFTNEEVLETMVLWAKEGQEAPLKTGPPLYSEGKVLSC